MIILNSREHCLLKCEIIKAIGLAFGDRKDSEPKLIANLTYYLPTILNNVSLSTVSFKVAGIFIHQKPYVKFTSPAMIEQNYVELGDILLINNFVCNNDVIKRTAMLLQAKKYKAGSKNIQPDNINQWNLYRFWPKFKYVRNKKLNNQIRSVNQNDRRDIWDGSKYLLIDTDNSIIPLSDYLAKPSKPLSNFRPLYCELFDFITGNSGKEFRFPAAQHNISWDRIINDLINEISNSPLTKRYQNGFGHNTRGYGDFYGEESIYATIKNVNIVDSKDDIFRYDELERISVIEITTLVEPNRY